jgi:hypothetical protein
MRSKAGDVFMPKKGPNDYWVFLFGGSAMEGVGSNKDGEWLDITGVEDYTQDKTIAHYMQEYLQEKMPGKKVRVFNAANSGYSILQSMRRYQRLSAKYQIDYVVSLDGENEPAELRPGQAVDAFIKQRWDSSALFKFPLRLIIPLTSHSAFLNKLKQASFHFGHKRRMNEAIENNFPAKSKWLRAPAAPLKFADADGVVDSAVDSFYAQLHRFDSLLTSRNVRHHLYVQPHLSLRDTAYMTKRELALYKYYTANYNDARHNSFKKKLFTTFDKHTRGESTVSYLKQFYQARQDVFIDYCHYTEETNKAIAQIIAAEILR